MGTLREWPRPGKIVHRLRDRIHEKRWPKEILIGNVVDLGILPLLRPVLAVTTVLNLLYALRVFDIVYVLTNGGPGYATDTVYTAIFNAFSLGQWGVATALSTLFFLVMLALGFVVLRVFRRSEVAYS